MGDKDNNFRSYCDEIGLYVNGEVLRPVNAEQWDDVLKLSHVRVSTFANGEVHAVAAKENALDLNRQCHAVTITNYKLFGGRQCCIVVKGGCSSVSISAEIQPEAGTRYDVQWDGWSDQCQWRSDGVLNLRRSDGLPVRLAFGRWHLPACGAPYKYKVMWWESVKLHAYNIFRDVCRVFSKL